MLCLLCKFDFFFRLQIFKNTFPKIIRHKNIAKQFGSSSCPTDFVGPDPSTTCQLLLAGAGVGKDMERLYGLNSKKAVTRRQ